MKRERTASSTESDIEHRSDEPRTVEYHGHHFETPHPATRYDAGNGQGTIHAWPHGKTQDRPVLDGSTQDREIEAEVDNPWRGIDDPGLIFYPGHVPESRKHHPKRAA